MSVSDLDESDRYEPRNLPAAPASWTVGHGQTRDFSTGRNLIRVSAPRSGTANPIVLAFAGSGFQGASLGAIPVAPRGARTKPRRPLFAFEPPSIRTRFTNAGAVFVEVAYRGGGVE